MKTTISFQENLFKVNNDNFNDFALKLFYFQAQNNEIYKTYLHHLNIEYENVNSISNIPFLPIEFFKHFEIKTGRWNHSLIFESSGTTGKDSSKHFVKDPDLYVRNPEHIFQSFYGEVKDYHILALLPSYLERNNSSLVYMVDGFIRKSESVYSGFYLNEFDDLYNNLKALKSQNQRTILFGVTFALLDFCDQYPLDFKDLIVIETGGMKGRKKEMTRMEIHERIKKGFSVEMVHSEYGMTELLSQCYSQGNGLFKTPNTMKIYTRELHDPFSLKTDGKTGGINIIDLANIDTCAFIETKDLGNLYQDGSVEILGRFDNSELRGCNLMTI